MNAAVHLPFRWRRIEWLARMEVRAMLHRFSLGTVGHFSITVPYQATTAPLRSPKREWWRFCSEPRASASGISIRGRISEAVYLIVVAGVLLVSPAAAKVTGGAISGTVTDPAGAMIAGADVTVENVATAETRR